MSTDDSHPILGNGLFFKLELPIIFKRIDAVSTTAKLNQIEMNEPDNPPFLDLGVQHQEKQLLILGSVIF